MTQTFEQIRQTKLQAKAKAEQDRIEAERIVKEKAQAKAEQKNNPPANPKKEKVDKTEYILKAEFDAQILKLNQLIATIQKTTQIIDPILLKIAKQSFEDIYASNYKRYKTANATGKLNSLNTVQEFLANLK